MDTNHSGSTAPSGSGETVVPTPQPANEPPLTSPQEFGWRFWLTVLGLVGLVTVVAIPNFVKPRTTACMNSCIANLKQIDGAIQQWALENKKAGTNTVNLAEMLDFLKGSVLPLCPANGTYSVFTVSEAPRCTQSAIGHSL